MSNRNSAGAYRFYKWLLKPFIKLRFRYSCDKELSSIKGPFLLLSNHNTDLDPVFVGEAVDGQLSFVASEHIMHKGWISKYLLHVADVITITKGKTALKTTKEMIGRLREGRSVLIFPEGNRSFNGVTMHVDSSCGKIAKIAGVPLVTARIEGGYLTQPRWGKGFRKGRIKVHFVAKYDPEVLKAMDEPEIEEHINEDLYENAFESQNKEKYEFTGSNLAEGLETTLFMCPKCGKISTLKTQGSSIFCDECGFKAEFNTFGELTGDESCPKDIAAWDEWQKTELENHPEIEFEDNVEIYEIDENHNQTLVYSGKFEMPEDVEGMAIYSRNVLVLHAGGKHLEVRGAENFCALKYLYRYSSKR